MASLCFPQEHAPLVTLSNNAEAELDHRMENYVDLQIVAESPDGVTVFTNEEPAVNQAQHSLASTTEEDQRTEVLEWDDGESRITVEESYQSMQITERPSLDANKYREAVSNFKPEEPKSLFPMSLPDAQLSDQDLEKGQASTFASTSSDPNIVDWDSPDDSANPYNWTTQRKWATVILITFQTFLRYGSQLMILFNILTVL